MLSSGVKRLILSKAATVAVVPPNPLAIFGANLVAWYNADVGVFTDAGTTPATNGQTVQQWNDQSGNGYNLSQATAGKRPTLNTTGYNSKRSITLAVANTTSMATGLSITNWNGLGTAGFFAVGQMTTTTAAFGRLLVTTSSPNPDFNDPNSPGAILLRNSSTNAVESFQTNAAKASFSVSLSTNLRLAQTQDGSTLTTYLNGASANSASQGATTYGTNVLLGIGVDYSTSTPGASAFWDGPVREIVAVNVMPSGSQLTKMDAWLVYNNGV